jgi:hypothetical protein
MTFLKKYASTAQIVYVDRYNTFGTFYRSYRNAALYDRIVPLDISTVSGKSALPENLKYFEFSHEYRLLWTRTRPNNKGLSSSSGDINNNHIIPANKNIEKGLSILSAGRPAYMEGYLVHLKGLGKDASFDIKSALYAGEKSKDKAGGRSTGLCRIIYLTKLVFDGYIFE